MIKFKLNIKDTATPGLQRANETILAEMTNRLAISADLLLQRMREHCTPIPNYSLAQLRAMGHPYARRFWTQQGKPWEPSAGTPAEGIHDPAWEVNVQSGQLRTDLARSQVLIGPSYMSVRVGVPEEAPSRSYAQHVIFGTSKMAPRNFPVHTMFEEQEKIRQVLTRPLT